MVTYCQDFFRDLLIFALAGVAADAEKIKDPGKIDGIPRVLEARPGVTTDASEDCLKKTLDIKYFS